jgi:hypothetical protein
MLTNALRLAAVLFCALSLGGCAAGDTEHAGEAVEKPIMTPRGGGPANNAWYNANKAYQQSAAEAT